MTDKTHGPTVYTALIMPLSSHATFPKPTPPPQPGVPPPTGGQPPHIDHTLPGDLPHPEHPIYWPLPPGVPVDPGFGNPWFDPHPDHELPGSQPRPDHTLPPHVDNTLPILPPDSGGWDPVYIWGGPGSLPTAPHPDHDLPVPIPPDVTLPGIDGTIKFKAIWTPSNGWQTIGVVIPGEGATVPTPAKKK